MWLAVAGHAFGAAPAAEYLLPSNTVAFVTVPNFAAAQGPWVKQGPARFWSNPGMGAFRAHFEASVRTRLVEPWERLTGIEWRGLSELLEGQVTFAMLEKPGPAGRLPRFDQLLVVDAAGREAALDRWYRGTLANLRQAGNTVRIAHGGEYVVLSLSATQVVATLDRMFPRPEPPAAEAGPTGGYWTLAMARRGTVLLAATSAAAVESLLSRLAAAEAAGPGGSTNSPPLTIPMTSRPGVLGHGWARVSPFLQAVSRSALPLGGLGEGRGLSVTRLTTALGLGELRSVTFAVRAGDEGWYLDFGLSIPSGRRRGVFRMFDWAPLDAAPPAFLAPGVRSFARARFSGKAAWEGFERAVGDLDPTLLGLLQLLTGYAGKTEDAEFDFRSRVIELLGDDWSTATIAVEGRAEPARLVWFGSPKAEALLEALDRVASPAFLSTFLPPGEAEPTRGRREYQGHAITTLTLPPIPWFGGTTSVVHFAVRDGQVAVSEEATLLEAFLSTHRPAVGGFREMVVAGAARAGGTETGYSAFVDEREWARTLFGSMRESPEAVFEHLGWVAISEHATRLVAGLVSCIEPSKWPAFEAVAADFGPRYTSGRSTADGFEWTTYRPVGWGR